MTLCQVPRELQTVLAVILGTRPLCSQPVTLARLAAALAGTRQPNKALLEALRISMQVLFRDVGTETLPAAA